MISEVIWHDIECGRYTQDLPLWRELAAQYVTAGGALLDVGAGAGRVSLELADDGHDVVALDRDDELLAELRHRAERRALTVETVCADAREFDIPGRRFSLVIVPMQTIQLLGGAAGRRSFLESARAHMLDRGALAVALAMEDDFEEFEWRDGDLAPLPDVAEQGEHSYFSQPTAVRRVAGAFVLERRREHVDGTGSRSVSADAVTLDIVSVEGLQAAGREAGLRPVTVLDIPPTADHIGARVVVLGA